ncbi:hypothetical protein [Thiomicrorhabdus sp. Kp2]|uniref:hypothetical protein n=1 Tax=Thiomicrorhabdus sp. Kp2 TaxID=1123518 RepID=UPI00040CE251|nr:hypothetical protein [Thiomicrorhabdus sp. Kp2]
MTEQLEDYTDSNNLVSDKATKAKNKLLAISSIVIFYITFEPSLTGSLSPFSVTINNNWDYLPVFIRLVLLWFLFRYIFLLIYSSNEISLSIKKPHRIIGILFRQNYTPLSDSITMEKNKLEEKINSFHSINGFPPPQPASNLSHIITDETIAQNEYRKQYSDYENHQLRLNNYILPDLKRAQEIDKVTKSAVTGLIIMDFLFPLALAITALILLFACEDLIIINFAT